MEMSAKREGAEDYNATPIATALDSTFDNEKLVAFKGNSANCLVFEYYNELPKLGKEHKSAFLMCPVDNSETLKSAFSSNMDKAWKDLPLNIIKDV